jgi:hypothetical protein
MEQEQTTIIDTVAEVTAVEPSVDVTEEVQAQEVVEAVEEVESENVSDSDGEASKVVA